MAPSDVEGSGENGPPVNDTMLGSGGTHVAGEDNLDEAMKTKEALDKLKAMCVVLGINYTSKLSEFGSMRDSKRVEEYLNFLTVTRDNNFKELKQISINLKEAWQTYNTPISRIENFSWILPILDAERAEEVKESNILSTAFVKKAENEVSKLIKERSKKLQGKYSTLKKKLEKLLKETHLMANDFEFDVKKQVNIEDYKYEKKLLKSIIRDVKSASAMRKELVLSVEMVRRGVANKNCSLDDLDVMIDRASKILYNLEFEEFYEYVSYDGQGVHDLLRTLRMQAVNYANDQSQKTRTRSGRTAYPD